MTGLAHLLRARWRSRPVPIWYHPSYRLPLPALDEPGSLDLRRADLAVWYLTARRLLDPADLRTPVPVSYADLERVHIGPYLEGLARPDMLARIFAVDPSQVVVDEVLRTVRMACGGTVAAARECLAAGGAALNLLGGFHHAAPDRGGGLCAFNDIAVALAVLRADGFGERAAVLDLDAHPPDGTAACLQGDPLTWLGSLSGSDWGQVEGADEVLLPPGIDDPAYLAALEGLLARMPRPHLAFVVAGGDVLAGDRFGRLGLTLDGARRRDLRVAEALDGIPTVWLPGGGYHDDAWRVLAGTALALTRASTEPVPSEPDPMSLHFAAISAGLEPARLHQQGELTQEDLEAQLMERPHRSPSLLGYYTADGIEYALHQFGVLALLERLGYGRFRVVIDSVAGQGDRARLFGCAAGGTDEHLLVECALDREKVGPDELLYIHWLSLRNPRARFGEKRPRLPGQEAPGLGLAREMGALLTRVAERLGLVGLAFRPAYYHTAYVARRRFRFIEPARQGRFEALTRDLGRLPLAQVTTAVAEGRVQMNQAPYRWEPDMMASFREPRPIDEAEVSKERERVHFALAAEPGGSHG